MYSIHDSEDIRVSRFFGDCNGLLPDGWIDLKYLLFCVGWRRFGESAEAVAGALWFFNNLTGCTWMASVYKVPFFQWSPGGIGNVAQFHNHKVVMRDSLFTGPFFWLFSQVPFQPQHLEVVGVDPLELSIDVDREKRAASGWWWAANGTMSPTAVLWSEGIMEEMGMERLTVQQGARRWRNLAWVEMEPNSGSGGSNELGGSGGNGESRTVWEKIFYYGAEAEHSFGLALTNWSGAVGILQREQTENQF